MKVLYADVELTSTDYFVETPEGNYFNFPSSEYNSEHDDVIITDTKSHKKYIVKFNV